MKRAFAFGNKDSEQAVKRLNRIKRIAVIGAGTMGQGIAIDILTKTDFDLVLIDIDPKALDRARQILADRWAGDVKNARIRPEDAKALESRIIYSKSYDDLIGCDIIWEAVTERLDIKAKIFTTIQSSISSSDLAAIFSNTSSHTTAELAELFTSDSYRAKFLTVHGYFPFEANRLIDVMKGKYASEETFALGALFADQILEKTTIALPIDHHGYVTDPIFQAMAAIVSWDVKTSKDITQLGGIWDLFTANPFSILDQTGHMPYYESSRHMGAVLPKHDRLRVLYDRDGAAYPQWVARLEKSDRTGVNSKTREGFYAWSDSPRPKPQLIYDPQTDKYVPITDTSRSDFWSYFEAADRDRSAGKIKSVDSLVFVARADDAGGRAFRRYVLPICLYCMDLIQDGYATPGQINISTRTGLRYKSGLIELIDALIANLTIDGLLELIHRARDENADDPYMLAMLDTAGAIGPRKGIPCLLHDMRKRNIKRLLGYGSCYRTPVAQLDRKTGTYTGSYPDLKFYEPNSKDRVVSIVFNSALRGNVFNKAVIDQLSHAFGRALDLHKKGRCGAILFSAAGTGMRMLGADAKEFNRGWFDRDQGYAPLTEDQAAASSRNAVALFRTIQQSPIATISVTGEKWGGGAEFTYFLDLRYDVRQSGYQFDALERISNWIDKPIYNQPELDYAILPGFGAAAELQRLGLGHSAIFEIFDQGLTADRAYQLGLSNGVFDDELEALRRGYERARQMAKDAPYSRALFKHELARGQDDEALAHETGEIFNPKKNPFINAGLIKLLDRAGRPPPMDYRCAEVKLPGWKYPIQNGTLDIALSDDVLKPATQHGGQP